MPRSTREWSEVRVLGYIWQPGVSQCAQHYIIERHQIANILQRALKSSIAGLTREDLDAWVRKEAHDFESIEDFSALLSMDGTDYTIPWQKAESEDAYMDATFGARNWEG